MKRKAVLSFLPVVFVLFCILPATAAINNDIVLTLEAPAGGETYSGVSNLRGWAVGPQGIDHIELSIDGAFLANVPYGGRRKDVGNQYPSFPGADQSGFSMAFNYSNLSEGQHVITTRAVDPNGGTREAAATIIINRFTNPFMADPEQISLAEAEVFHDENRTIFIEDLLAENQHYDVDLTWRPEIQGFAIKPTPATAGSQSPLTQGWNAESASESARTPLRAEERLAATNENILLTLEAPASGATYSGVSNLRGWAVGPQGIDHIELSVDGAFLANVPYGGRRKDVGNQYPSFPEADQSGFSMAFNYSNLSEGQHLITTRAVDHNGVAREATAALTINRFANPFIADPEQISLAGADVFHDERRTILIEDLLAENRHYDVDLTWRPEIQGFAINYVRPYPVDIEELDPPPNGDPSAKGLVFEEYNAIRGDKYFDDHVFALETRPRGSVFEFPLQITDRNATPARDIPYELAHYNYSAPAIQPPLTIVPEAGRYIAGLQVIHKVLGSNDSFPIILNLNSSGYLRLTGEPPRRFGTSYRVATHNVGSSRPKGDRFNEEFPRIIKASTKVVEASRAELDLTVDGEAFTGSLHGELVPGAESLLDVDATFIMRRDVDQGAEIASGFVGLSSLFFRGEANTPGTSNDEAHDADFLVVTFSNGSTTELALENPDNPNDSTPPLIRDFVAPAGHRITSFALEQRDRDPSHYSAFASADYALRSSIAIEDIRASIPLQVKLQIFPTTSEYHDNVVAHLTLLESLKQGEAITLSYRVRAH